MHIKLHRIVADNAYFVSPEWSDAHAKSILETGDVLIVQTGDVGQSAVVTDEFAGSNCHALIIVAPKKELMEGEWLSAIAASDYGFQTLLSIQTGALHPHLNCGDVKDLFCPLPPLSEQREIILWLRERRSEFDGLILAAESAIGLLEERRSALISAAVTGKIDIRGERNGVQ
jgi:type I restriction enzyme S subunit